MIEVQDCHELNGNELKTKLPPIQANVGTAKKKTGLVLLHLTLLQGWESDAAMLRSIR